MVYIVYLYYLFANTSWFQRPVKNFGLNFAPWFLRVETQNSARILFTGMLNNCRLPVVSFFALKAQFYDFWGFFGKFDLCLLYTSPSPRDLSTSRMPSSA